MIVNTDSFDAVVLSKLQAGFQWIGPECAENGGHISEPENIVPLADFSPTFDAEIKCSIAPGKIIVHEKKSAQILATYQVYESYFSAYSDKEWEAIFAKFPEVEKMRQLIESGH